MTESLEQRIIDVVQTALANNGANPDIEIGAADSMETIAAWDSLSFMRVFLAVNEVFGISSDFDDAIHYTSVNALHIYLQEKVR